MTVETTPPTIISIGENVPGILTAKDPPPKAIETAQLPCLYVFTGEATNDWSILGRDDVGVVTRMYRIQVAVVPKNQATPETRETRCRPLIEAVRNEFAKYPHLGVDGVFDAVVVGDSGPAILPEWEGKYVGFEVRLEVRSVIARSYADGE